MSVEPTRSPADSDEPEPTDEPAEGGEGGEGGESARPKLRQRVQAVQARGAEVLVQLDAARPQHRSVDIAFRLGEHDRRIGGGLLAGALAFRLFLWALPATLVFVGALSIIGSGDATAVVHAGGLESISAASVADALGQAHSARWVLLLLGLVLMYSASVTLARTVAAAVSLAWGMVPTRVRRAWRAAGLTVATILAGLLASGAADRYRASAVGLAVGAWLILLLFWTGLWWLVQTVLPRPESVSRWQLWPGAVLVGLGLQALHLFTLLYLGHKLGSASKLYGALGGAATMLLWAYLMARLVIGGSALNATVAENRELAQDPLPPAENAVPPEVDLIPPG